LLNRYRCGQDSMAMHADDEPEMGNVIGSLSLGADPDVPHQAQQKEGDDELPGRQRHAHHHGRDDAAVLETWSPEDHGERRRAHQHDVQASYRGVIMSHFLIAGLLVLAVALTTAAAGDDREPPFKITTKRDDDRVEVKTEKDKVIFSVQSPFGISNAVIERKGEKWPDAVMLRLHLKGLENFKVTNGKVKLEGAASIQEGKPVV